MTGLRAFARRHRLALRLAAALAVLVLVGCVVGLVVTMLLVATGLADLALLVWMLVVG
jgi:hypothetical protein